MSEECIFWLIAYTEVVPQLMHGFHKLPTSEEFVLFAAASEGKAGQWDGQATPHGALLRWMLPASLGFPPLGFDVFRGISDPRRFKLHKNAIPNAAGNEEFALDTNTKLFNSRPLRVGGSGIQVGAGDTLTLVFSEPVSVVTLTAGNSAGDLQVRVLVGGRKWDDLILRPSHRLEVVTRGANLVMISGQGVLTSLETILRDGPYKWKKIAHLGLPLTHPNYPDSPPGDDFDLARSRLPAGADWDGHYREVFTGLHGLLKDMFDGSTAPFPPPTADGEPTLQLDRRAALFMTMLEPNVARMLGYAHDHMPDGIFPRDDFHAYKVEALWNIDPAHRDVRAALFPALKLREFAPFEPTDLDIRLDEIAGRPRAGLRWEPVPLSGHTADPPTLRYQPLARHVAELTGTPPTSVDLGQGDLLSEDPLLLPNGAARAQPAEPFIYNRVNQPGHIAYGVRGVDIFGRVSKPVVEIKRVDDRARPPPPRILAANYLQAEAPSTAQAALSQAAVNWLQRHPGDNAFEVVWEWPPELANRAPDVETFEVLVRLPIRPSSTGPHEADIDWESALWGAARLSLSPTATRLSGVLANVAPGLPTLSVQQVERLGDGAFRLHTDLDMEIGRAVLGRCLLTPITGGADLEIKAHGDGEALTLVVTGLPGARPEAGDYRLSDPKGLIFSMELGLSRPANVDEHHEGGTVVFSSGGRMARLGTRQDHVIGLLLPDEPGTATRLPADGEQLRWFPSYRVLFRDTGFGPDPSPAEPLAQAQVAMRSLRPPSPFSGPRISSPSAPHTVAAADYSRPPAPELPELLSGPRCAELASAADYYGISRFTLDWTARPNERYVVYRALRDSVLKVDRDAQNAGLPTHEFPADELPDDQQLKDLVQQEITALDSALAAGDEATIADAYEALGAESVKLIASRDVLRPAFTALQGEPLEIDTFEDQFDGRSRGSWIYRVASISSGGLEGGWSVATPPICAPDVVAPPAPQIQEVLAAEGAVILRWLKSPAGDLAQYRLYRSFLPGVGNIHDMEEVAVLAPDSDATLEVGQIAPLAVGDQPGWLEIHDPLEGGASAHYRLVAEDQTGNRSLPSSLSSGKALRAQPAPPVWDPPARNGNEVELSWTHPDDDRLSCRVERRIRGEGAWVALNGWLSRGEYELLDFNAQTESAWEYRLSVRDVLGLVSHTRPVIELAAEGGN